jgi:hypothetical protein
VAKEPPPPAVAAAAAATAVAPPEMETLLYEVETGAVLRLEMATSAVASPGAVYLDMSAL